MPKRKWTKADPALELDRIVEKGLVTMGLMLVGQAMELAPKRTGRLKGSISFATKKTKPQTVPGNSDAGQASKRDYVSQPDSRHTLHVGTNVEYAEAQEYPGKKRKNWLGKPYMRPALDQHRKDCPKILGDMIEQEYGK